MLFCSVAFPLDIMGNVHLQKLFRAWKMVKLSIWFEFCMRNLTTPSNKLMKLASSSSSGNGTWWDACPDFFKNWVCHQVYRCSSSLLQFKPSLSCSPHVCTLKLPQRNYGLYPAAEISRLNWNIKLHRIRVGLKNITCWGEVEVLKQALHFQL